MDQKIIETIQKLLARADADRNDNEHERAIAMRRANSLLVKHGLSMSDVAGQLDRSEAFGKLGRQSQELTTRYVWEGGVFNAIARLNGCKVVRSPGSRGQRQKVWLIGRQLHCHTTKYMAEYAVSSIKRQAKRDGFSVCSFGVGAWTGLEKQVTEILNAQKNGDIDGERVSNETALAVVDQHKQSLIDAERATSEFFPRLSGGSYGYGGDRDGVAAGRQYGRNMSLNKQVAGNSAPRLT